MPTARAPRTTPLSSFWSPAYRGDDNHQEEDDDEVEDDSDGVGKQEDEVSTNDIGELLAGKDTLIPLKILNCLTTCWSLRVAREFVEGVPVMI